MLSDDFLAFTLVEARICLYLLKVVLSSQRDVGSHTEMSNSWIFKGLVTQDNLPQSTTVMTNHSFKLRRPWGLLNRCEFLLGTSVHRHLGLCAPEEQQDQVWDGEEGFLALTPRYSTSRRSFLILQFHS